MPENNMPHRVNYSKRGRFFKTRTILNIIFMIGALIGVILYFAVGKTVGTIVILVAVVFKITESILRFFH